MDGQSDFYLSCTCRNAREEICMRENGLNKYFQQPV